MITFENFLKIGQALQKTQKRSLDLYQNYQIDYEDSYSSLIDSLLSEVFNDRQKDMFD